MEDVAMRILILGGTRFVGRHLVEAALARDHDVTLFHRGRTNPGLHAGVERVLGDRDGGLEALGGRKFDAVVDVSGYYRRIVGASARMFIDMVRRYLFVSTISVYSEPIARGANEDAAVATTDEPDAETLEGGHYGALKGLCEQVVRDTFGERATIVRPGLVVGPHDYTGRFPYWPRRLARGGEVLAPGDPAAPIQMMDARDMAAFMVSLLERDFAGTYHATGPAEPLALGAALERIGRAVGSDAKLSWVSEEFLRERNVEPWVGLPLWLPAADQPLMTLDIARATAAGLRFRPLEETARDTLAWERATPTSDLPASNALAPEREAVLLAEWGRSQVT
jgi:2'-hydroxyisoflavone reductase